MVLSEHTQINSFYMGIALVLSMVFSLPAFAQQGPSTFNVSGGLYLPSGLPVTSANVNFKLEIWDKDSTCLLYTEDHLAQNLSASKGGFALAVGRGTNISNLLETTNALSSRVFENNGVIAGGWTNCPSGATLLPGDERVIRVHYDLGDGFIAMSPDVPIASAAYAMVAESLQGRRPTDFIQVRNDATYDLDQANVENVFSSTNYARLQQLLNPTAAVPFAGQRISNIATPTAAQDAATKGYTDGNLGGQLIDLVDVAPGAGGGKVLTWDQSANRWVATLPSMIDATKLPLAGGTMTGAINMGGNNLSNVGNISMGATRTLNLGTFDNTTEGALGLGATDAGKFWYNTQSGQLKVWSGTTAAPQAFLDAGGKLDASWIPDTTVTGASYGSATQVPTFTVGADGRLTAAANVTIAGVAPGGAAGGDLTGTYPNPTVANLAIGTSKLADDAVTSAKINSTGVATNRILMTDGTTGATVTYANCPNNEILKFATGTGWECATVASLSAVTSVAGKSGAVTLNAADIGGLGSAAVRNIGVTPGEVPELDAGSRILASLIPLFGGDVTGAIGANIVTRLQGRDLSSTAPNTNDVLMWNGTAWAPTVLVDAGITALTGDVSASGSGSVVATLTNGVVTTPKMFTNPGANRLIATDGTTGATLAPFVCNLDEIMQWGASGWACRNVSTALGTQFIVDGGNARGSAISIGTSDNYNLFFETNNATRMTILTSGNVGLGTTSPQSLLHVNGTVRATQICDENGANCKAINTGWGPGGTVTSVVAGAGLSGGTITTSGTLAIASGGVTSTHIADATIATADLGDNQVTNVKIASLAATKLTGNLSLDGKDTIQSSDTWLRLNQTASYTSGIHTPGFFNANSMTVGALFSSPGAGNLQVENNVTAASFTGSGAGLTGVNATQLNGQAASFYTDIGARLGYTPLNRAGDTMTGNLAFSAANPTITSGGSYIVVPNGLYVSGGTPYFQTQIQARGGLSNDSAAQLTINGGTNGQTYFAGTVGVGIVSPQTAVDVQGQIRSRVNNAGAGTSIDWNNGNVQYTSASCQAMTFSNMLEGGSYTLIVNGTSSGTCTFSQSSPDSLSGGVFKFVPANVPTIASKTTVFTFLRAGNQVFVSWIPGF